jgi:hypothetical protein
VYCGGDTYGDGDNIQKVTYAILLCFAPLIYELWKDRNGETAKNKRRQWLLIGLFYVIVSAVNWWVFEINPLRSLALCFAIRFVCFDYLINIILYQRGVIESREARKWWSYVGSTARWDQRKLWVRIGWGGRLACRAVVLVAAVFF